MQQQISMFFRNARRKSIKRKNENEGGKGKVDKDSTKVPKIGDDSTTTKRNLNLLKKAKENEFSRHTFHKLIKDTYTARREYIQHEAKATLEIIKEYTFLSEPEHVSTLNCRVYTV